MSSSTPRPNKAERRDTAREKARVLREQEARRDRRNKIAGIGILSVAGIALVTVVTFIVTQSLRPGIAYTADDAASITLADTTAPSTAGSNGGIPVGADGGAGEQPADGDVVVSVYFDYMCPYCGQFEDANDAELAALRAAGGVTVEYHPLAFLDSASQGADYSTRAGNAAMVVADQAPAQFSAFHSLLFDNQPEEGTKGLSDDRIADLAREAGVPQDVVDQFTATVTDQPWRTFAPWLAANNNQMVTDLGRLSTPTVLIDGEKFTGDLYSTGPLTQAIQAAQA
jgi:protein-disulfide isomerase